MSISILGNMSTDLLIPKKKLDYLIRSSPYRYKVYNIPKRSNRGMRTIAQPSKEVKTLQYWIIKNIFPSFIIHTSASAYISGKNILNNAEVHSDKPYLLKLDFKDFFPSIKGDDFLKYLKNHKTLSFTGEDLYRIIKILFWLPKRNNDLQLSIGAPSSPILSNAIMYSFDSKIFEYCSKKKISYTRYADDLTFSMHDMKMRGEILKEVEAVLTSQTSPSLKLNKEKTVFGSKAHRRLVTGLIITNSGTVSLGRKKKRCIRAQIHNYLNGRLSEEERLSLRGMLSFACSVEPGFVKRMKTKYSPEVINKI